MSVYAAVVTTALQFVGCPPSIQDRQAIAAPPPKEWSVHVPDRPRPLWQVDVYHGPPEQMKLLIGSDGKRGGTEWGGRDLWVECIYADSAVVLRRHLGKVRCAFVRVSLPDMAPTSFTCTK